MRDEWIVLCRNKEGGYSTYGGKHRTEFFNDLESAKDVAKTVEGGEVYKRIKI